MIGSDDDGAASPTRSHYKWAVVAMLWFCGFFNYADRQAVFSVFPVLGKEFGLSNSDKGWIGSAFMIVYAIMAPLAGFIVDQKSRRRLILAGLGFWSLICAATATSRRFWQLLVFRAAEGLGETFYFPASMSVLADYHSAGTRSRAMGLHQTSVYAGTALGGLLAGFLGQRYGWRSPFWVLGLIGTAYVPLLGFLLIEPKRTREDVVSRPVDELNAATTDARPRLLDNVAEVVINPVAVLLLLVFICANFVASTFLTWLPDFVYHKYKLDLLRSSAVATLVMPLANLVGAILGGVLADWAAKRPGGRVLVQASGLLLGSPFIYLVGATSLIPVLIVALIGIGLCKGVYDANIFASIYDVVRPEVRGTSAGLMNTVGWTFGSFAPVMIGVAADRFSMSQAISATAAVYVLAGILALAASKMTARRAARLGTVSGDSRS
jgi:MFS family permease